MTESPPLLTTRHWLDEDGTVRGKVLPGANYRIEEAIRSIEIIENLGGGRPRGLLMDITEMRSMSREARAYFGEPSRARAVYAVALIVNSLLSRSIGNFILGFNRPVVPVRLFTDEAEAIAWLRSFHYL
jgi:hypothetical protein